MRPSNLALAFAAASALVAASPGRATVLVVNSPIDVPDFLPDDGVCETAPGNGVCTLRAAVETAHAANPFGLTEIQLAASTYSLSLGPLDVYASLKIRGANRRSTVVQLDPQLDEGRFIFHIDGNLSLEDLTIRGFRSTHSGGAIASFADGYYLQVRRADLLDNRAQDTGGFLHALEIDVTVEECVFAWNAADSGGDLYLVQGDHVVRDSIFEAGSAVNWGGSIAATQYADLFVERSFFADNSAASGGAMALLGDETRLINSTITGNRAWNWGGGIFVGGTASLDAVNATITGNLANAAYDANGLGGGIFSDVGADVAIFNSILSGNQEARFVGGCGCWLTFNQECVGAVGSNGYNVVRSNDGSCAIAGAVTATDPLLPAAAYNGGFSRTQALVPESPAVDAGNPVGCYDDLGAPVATDQRGAARPYGAGCDLGAFERGSLIFDDDFELGVPRWLSQP